MAVAESYDRRHFWGLGRKEKEKEGLLSRRRRGHFILVEKEERVLVQKRLNVRCKNVPKWTS